MARFDNGAHGVDPEAATQIFDRPSGAEGQDEHVRMSDAEMDDIRDRFADWREAHMDQMTQEAGGIRIPTPRESGEGVSEDEAKLARDLKRRDQERRLRRQESARAAEIEKQRKEAEVRDSLALLEVALGNDSFDAHVVDAVMTLASKQNELKPAQFAKLVEIWDGDKLSESGQVLELQKRREFEDARLALEKQVLATRRVHEAAKDTRHHARMFRIDDLGQLREGSGTEQASKPEPKEKKPPQSGLRGLWNKLFG